MDVVFFMGDKINAVELRPMQMDATSHNIVGPNNVGSCWHLLRDACKRMQHLQLCWRKVVILASVNNSPFCPKLFLYLFIGPLMFFPQIIVFI